MAADASARHDEFRDLVKSMLDRGFRYTDLLKITHMKDEGFTAKMRGERLVERPDLDRLHELYVKCPSRRDTLEYLTERALLVGDIRLVPVDLPLAILRRAIVAGVPIGDISKACMVSVSGVREIMTKASGDRIDIDQFILIVKARHRLRDLIRAREVDCNGHGGLDAEVRR